MNEDDAFFLSEFISYRRIRKILMFNGILGYELRRASPRPDRHPNGLPMIVMGETICLTHEDVRDMMLEAGQRGIEPCEFDGDPRVYRIGVYVLVPENSGL